MLEGESESIRLMSFVERLEFNRLTDLVAINISAPMRYSFSRSRS